MKIWRLPGLLILRSLVRELTQIRQILAVQTTILNRLADHFAPIAPETDPAVVREETGVSHADLTDQALIESYVVRTHEATGHWATDDEILTYLSDEKTRDLHTRLIDRDREIAQRLREGRG